MKILKTILLSFSGLVLAIIVTAVFIITGIKKSGIPEYSGEIKIEGLSSPVTVYRDEKGMPHIYAADEHDLYIAVGYVMSQERLWQMDLIRRVTTGRLSEIFGEEYVQTDLLMRSLDMTTKSKKLLANGDSLMLSCVEWFTQGVNAYITDAGKDLPPEFRLLRYKPDPWIPENSANIIGYMGWDLASGNMSTDIFIHRLIKMAGIEKATDLIPDWEIDTSEVFPGFRLDDESLSEAESLIASADKIMSLGVVSFSASNNWAVSGSKTNTGKPILSNDMHLGLNSPGIWMQMHQVVPGKLNVTGVVIPGEPFIVAGHNEKIAWGMTNLMVDDIDLFAEKINPADNNQYYFNGEWKTLDTRREIIRIKGKRQDTLTLKFTHRGAIISDLRGITDAALSMRWSGYDMSDELKAVYLLDRAENIDEFRSAISNFRSVSQNIVYADTDGNIGLNTGGGVPLRKGTGSIIRNGETDEYDWKGYVPFKDLPCSYNPDEGFVSSANNRTVSDEYPFYISFRFALPYRINRIREMLTEKDKYTIEDFKRMITDQHSDYAGLLTPFILKLKDSGHEMNDTEKQALTALEGWDYNMDRDKAAPLIFEFISGNLGKDLLGDELGDLSGQLPGIIKDYYIFRILREGPDGWVDNINTPETESLDDILMKSFRNAVNSLTAKLGPDMSIWKWGSVHTISLEHPLASVKILNKIFRLNSEITGVGGSNHTVCPYTYNSDYHVTDGASERHIFNTADWDDSYTVIPTGASGVPSSEFYLSQTKAYVNGEFYMDPFTEGAVKEAAKYELRFIPSE